MTLHRSDLCKPYLALITVATVSLIAACGGLPVEPQAPKMALNDSGRSSCSNLVEADLPCPLSEFPGQDGDHGRDVDAQHLLLTKKGGGMAGFDFTKIGAAGAELSVQNRTWIDTGNEAQGSRWTCVRDNTTGLLWEMKDPAATHPRYALSTYSWYNPNNSQNGGFAGHANKGICNQGSCDSQGYVNYVNSIALCGVTDWRLPTAGELLSLAHHGRVDPAIDTDYFPGPLGLRHWTASPHSAIPQLAWYVYFSDGSISYTDKSNASYIRLVR